MTALPWWCPVEFSSISFPRLGFRGFYSYFGLDSPDSSPLPAPPAQMPFLNASLGRVHPIVSQETQGGLLARLTGRAGGRVTEIECH